jgi:hypothetical protein
MTLSSSALRKTHFPLSTFTSIWAVVVNTNLCDLGDGFLGESFQVHSNCAREVAHNIPTISIAAVAVCDIRQAS